MKAKIENEPQVLLTMSLTEARAIRGVLGNTSYTQRQKAGLFAAGGADVLILIYDALRATLEDFDGEDR